MDEELSLKQVPQSLEAEQAVLGSILIDSRCVTEVIVPKTNVYPFDLSGFDEEKATSAEKRNDLPSGIHFHLDNGVNLCLNGSDIEYFYVELRE